jgi:hypothetical protein
MTPQQMLTRMVETIEPRTGRSWHDWVAVARAAGIDKHKALTVHLKTEHGLNHNEAQWLAWEITDPGRRESYSKPKDLVSELYSGKKAGLRPLYDALYATGMGVGEDIRPNVCKTYTSLATKRQFAMINPRTQKAVDVDLSLPDSVTSDRLVAQKNSNPNFSQKVRVSDPAEVDEELVRLLTLAAEHARG